MDKDGSLTDALSMLDLEAEGLTREKLDEVFAVKPLCSVILPEGR